jgi:ABC-2 type transport system permease protein
MRAFGQLYRASLREWRRDSTALLWSMAFPVVIALAIGVIFSGSGTIFFRVGLVNEAGAAGLPLVNGFTGNAAFRVTHGTRQDELDALDKGQREAVVIITGEAGSALVSDHAAADGPVPLEVYTDSASNNTQGVLNLIQQTITAVELRLSETPPKLIMQAQTVNTHQLRTADYMLPGVLAMSLMLMGLYVTAQPLVSLRERAVLRRMGSTPLTRVTLLASQIVFRITVALIQAAVVIVISVGVFDLPLAAGDLPAVVGLVLLGAAVFIALGYFLAALAKTEEAVQVVVGLAFLLFTILSGALVPLWRIPGWVRPLVDAIPLTYLSDALRQVMVGANPAFSMTRDIGVLVVWLVVCLVLALRLFRWEPQS